MTPQEQAQAVADAAARARCLYQWSTVNDPPCHPSDEGWTGCHLCISHSNAGDAAIRAAVDLVLPEEPGPEGSDPSRFVAAELMERFYERLCVREEILAIAAELEAPTNG
jgi:hypothetical protein